MVDCISLYYGLIRKTKFGMKKVLFVLPDLRVGGTSTSFNVLYNNIFSDYDITVLPISNYNDVEINFADKVICGSRLLSLFYANSKALNGLERWMCLLAKLIGKSLISLGVDFEELIFKCQRKKLIQYDVVVAYQEGYVTRFCSKIKAMNKIAWIHCNYDSYLPPNEDESAVYNNFQHIVCVSEFTSNVFKHRYPLLSSKVVGVYNLMDIERIVSLSKENVSDIKRVENRFYIISVGRITPVKRFEEIPQIACGLRKRNLNFCWYIVGPDDDPPTTHKLLDAIKGYQVEDCVKWLGGKANPYPYFKKANLYVCLSESEACPMVFIEANILGVPVVTTDFGSSYEFIKQNENGLITKRESLVDSIYSVYQNLHEWKDKTLIDNPKNYNKLIVDKLHLLFS